MGLWQSSRTLRRSWGLALIIILFQALSMTVWAAQPDLELTPGEINFPATLLNEQSGPEEILAFNPPPHGNIRIDQVEVVNDSGQADFQIFDDQCTGKTLGDNGECNVQILFTPKVEGDLTGTVHFHTTPSGDYQVALTGQGIPDREVSLTPDQLDFHNVLEGTDSDPQVVTLQNVGTTDLTIQNISSDDSMNFPVVGDTCSGAVLAPLASCKITVQFTPTTAGNLSTDIQISSNSEAGPSSFPVKGFGVSTDQPLVEVNPFDVNFGNVATDASSPAMRVVISNEGSAVLNMIDLNVSGAGFSIVPGTDHCSGIPISPSNSCTVDVIFTPPGLGPAEGTLSIRSNATSSPDQVSLIGTGVDPDAPILNAEPSPINFGQVDLNRTMNQVVTVHNVGQLDLLVESMVITGPDALYFVVLQSENKCTGRLVVPGGTCTALITFTPLVHTTFHAELQIFSNASDDAQTFELIGEGVKANGLGGCSLNNSPQTNGALLDSLLFLALLALLKALSLRGPLRKR